jgi:antitoxin ParD1/3/4
MDIVLRPEVEKLVEHQLRTGRFASADELIEAAIVRLAKHDETAAYEPEELDSLRAQIAVGVDQLDRGQGSAWDLDRVRSEGRRLLNDAEKEA